MSKERRYDPEDRLIGIFIFLDCGARPFAHRFELSFLVSIQ